MSGLYLAVVALLAGMLWVIVPPTVVKPTNSTGVALLVYLCLLFLKVLLDDAVHFSDKKKNGENWSHGLGLTILWNLLALNAIRVAASDVHSSLMFAILAQLVGTAWIVQNYIHKAPGAEAGDKQRHIGWAYINILSIAVLAVLDTYVSIAVPWLAVSLLVGLSILVLFDALYFGTLTRVSGAFD
jgi:hypothetical protein